MGRWLITNKQRRENREFAAAVAARLDEEIAEAESPECEEKVNPSNIEMLKLLRDSYADYVEETDNSWWFQSK